jgi:hypothetical protein
MKLLNASLLATLAALLCQPLGAAQLNYQGHYFEAHVIQSSGARYREFSQTGQARLQVRPEEEYSIIISNPLPVRVGVAVSIDGLNSIDGKRSSPRNARKWILEPNSSMTIDGWQTNSSTLRKFVFTKQDAAYAQWKESKEGKPYTKNLGVIGVAWFWNSDELERALHPPQPFADEAYNKAEIASGNDKRRMKAPAAMPSAAAAEDRAGTGMGRQQSNHVTEVEFHPTAGMYSVRDVLKIFYEFAKEPPQPMPFVSEEEDNGRFAPDMNITK